MGVGEVTVVGSTAVVNSFDGVNTLIGQYGVAQLYCTNTNAFLLVIQGATAAPPEPPEPIPAGFTSSAGVFDGSGMLVRTLWNVVTDHPDAEAPTWDGELEDGSVAPSGDYTIKVVAHECTYTWEGVIGNTSPDHSTMRYWNEAGGVSDMEIAADGKMFYASGYHERLPTMGYSTTADVQNMDYTVNIGFRASYSNSLYVTTDGTIVYYARWEGSTYMVTGVTIATKAFVDFPSGVSWGGIAGGAIAVDTSATRFISSIAVQRSGSYLFVARPEAPKLLTVDKTSGATLQTNTTFIEPTVVETSPTTGDLWLAHKVAGVWRITKCAVDGLGNVTLTGTQTTATIEQPRSMSISPDGATLLLCDAGASQQIKAFNTSDATVKASCATSGALGIAGGYAASPDVTNTKFMFEVTTIFGGAAGWVSYEPGGSFWVGDSGNCRHLHFDSSGAFIGKVAFIPSFYACGVCRGDPTRVFVDFLEFAIDYDLPAVSGWTLSKNWGFGHAGADQYGRLRFVGVYGGRTYAAFNAGSGRKWFELTASGLRDTGVTLDVNTYVDAEMNLYFTLTQGVLGAYARIAKNPFAGFDGSNNPTWTYPLDWSAFDVHLLTADLPAGFPVLGSWDGNTIQNSRIEATENNVIPFFDSNGQRDWDGTSRLRDINFLGGVDATSGAVKFMTLPSHGGPSPGENRGGIDRRFLLYPEVPYYATQGVGPNGGGVFAYEPGTPYIFACDIGEGGWGNNQVNMWYHYHDSGLMLGQFGAAAPYFASTTLRQPDALNDGIPNYFYSFKALDGMAGNSKWGGLAIVDGVTYLYQNDEWYQGGLHRWKIEDLDSLIVNSYDVVWDAGDYEAPAADPTDLLAGLPLDQANLTNGVAGWTRAPTTNNTTSTSGPWARVMTNSIRCDPRSPRDITLEAVLDDTIPASVSRAIPRVGSGNWTLSGKTYLLCSDFNNTRVALEILDNVGKVIFTIYNFATPSVQGCKVNGVDLIIPIDNTDGQNKWQFETEREVLFSVAANVAGATMVVNYGSHNVTGLTVFEVGAAIGSPATVRLKFYPPPSPSVGFGAGNISQLHYVEA
jgi:hypothetical protein